VRPHGRALNLTQETTVLKALLPVLMNACGGIHEVIVGAISDLVGQTLRRSEKTTQIVFFFVSWEGAF
jgi:hypothetical protein